ncbi:hypothetical protein ABPG72_016274 [Tetrahymena utriculariae]
MKNIINKTDVMVPNQNGRILTEEQKWGVIIGWKYYDSSYDELMKKFNIKSKGTISKLIDKYQIQKNVSNNMSFSGRNNENEIITDLVKESVQNQVEKKFNMNEIQAHFNQEYGYQISKTKLHKELKKLGLKYGRANIIHQLSDSNKLARKTHCKNYSYQMIDDIVFSDESIFSLRDNKVEIWYSQEFSKNIEIKPLQYNEQYIHIWAGVSKRGGKTNIHIYEESVNAEMYIKCLEQTYIPYLKNVMQIKYSNPQLLQDGARPHTAKVTLEYLNKNKIAFIQNSPYSPDLNAIELVWAKMKKIFKKENINDKIKNKQDLIDCVQQIWQNDITQQFVNDCISHIQDKMIYVFENNGSY